MPDQQCPVPMDKLGDYRRTKAHKHDGTTEDFEEKLHSLEHSQQKRMLNTAWKCETWFRPRRMQDHQGHQSQHRAKHFQHPVSSKKNSHSKGEDTQGRSQRDQKRWQQAMSNGQAVDKNHPQQQAFHDQRNFQQLKTIGCKKDICGKKTTSSPEQHSTYHNKHKMGQMSQS